MGTSIIAHCNTSSVFDSTKHAFNFVALFIQIFVVGNSYFSGFPGRDARRDASFEQGIGTNRHHILGQQGVPWPWGRRSTIAQFPCSHLSGRETTKGGLACPRHCKQREVWSSVRLLCARYSGKEPFFKQACCRTMGFKVGGINH